MRLHNSKTTVYTGFGLLSIFIIALTAIGFAHSISVSKEFEKLTEVHHDISNLTYEMRLSVRERLISLTLIANLADLFARDAEMLRFNTLGTRFASARIKLTGYNVSPDEQTLLDKQASVTQALRPLHDEFIDHAMDGRMDQARLMLTEQLIPAHNEVIDIIKELHGLQESLNHHAVNRYTRKQELSYVSFMSLLGVSTILVGGMIGFFVSRKINGTEQALLKEKERYALAVRGANDGIWDWDLETNQVYFSPRWKDILGHEDHEIPNRLDQWFMRIHPDDSEQTLAKLNNHLNGHSYYFESVHRMQHQDGSYHWVHDRALAMRDEQGKSYRIAGSMEDVTEQRMAEERLKNSEKHMRAVLDSVREGIVTTDKDGNIESINQAAELILQIPGDEAPGRNLREFFTEPDKLDASMPHTATTSGGADQNITRELVTIKTQDQARQYDLTTTHTVLDGQAKLINIFKATSGIPSRKSA